MPVIPTVPGSSQIQTPDSGVKLDFGTLNAPNQAKQELAGVVNQVGRQLGEFGQQMQAAKNYGIAADADREMRQASADFQASRVGRDDEENWGTEWKERAERVKESIYEKHGVGPNLRRQLDHNFKNWDQANAIEVRTMANRQAVNRAVDRVELSADEAAKDADEQGIKAVFAGAVAHRLMLPEQAKKAEERYLNRIDEYAAKNYIMSNPAGAVAFLEAETKAGKPENLTRLTPDQRLTLLNAARVQFTKFQTENYQELIEGLQNGQVRSPEQLQQLVETKVITPKQRKSYETAYLHGNFNTSPDAIGTLLTDITNYDPQQDPKMTERAKLLARVSTSGFPTNVQSEANQLLGQKSDPKNILNTPVAKDAFEAIDQRFRLGLYGKYETKTEDRDGNIRTVVNPKVYEQAMVTKRRVEDATRKYLREKPEATAEEVNRFVSGVQMSNVVAAGRQTILGGLPGMTVNATPEQKKARLDAILDKAKK